MYKALEIRFIVTERPGTPETPHPDFSPRIQPQVVPTLRDHIEGLLRRTFKRHRIEEFRFITE